MCAQSGLAVCRASIRFVEAGFEYVGNAQFSRNFKHGFTYLTQHIPAFNNAGTCDQKEWFIAADRGVVQKRALAGLHKDRLSTVDGRAILF